LRFTTVFFAAALLLFAADARPADKDGQYAIRGAGLISCAIYNQERAARSNVYLVTAAWVDGYITGINQYAPQTYDVLSFEGTELLMSILTEHCKSNPTDPVFGVLASLFRKLWPDRVTGKSEKTTIVMAERDARHYVELIKRAQKKLRAKRFYSGAISGNYSPQTVEAMKRYQKSIGFDPTGFPDQLTLWRLMRSE
jgi:hypothetical protein